MSLIDSIQGLGGYFSNNRAASAVGTSATGTTGATQSMDSLLKSFSAENVQNASETEMARITSGVSGTSATDSGRSIFAETPASQDSFASTLSGFIDSVDAKSKVAEQANSDIMTGKSDNIHQAMISMQEASISFDLLVQVRNKLVDSYKELSRMTV